MKSDEDKLLVRIAEMYYQEDKNQSQIAKELNIHRTSISRLLKRSREEGVVQITINYDMAGTYTIEQQLEERYGLLKAVVVPAAPEMKRMQKDQLLGKAVDEYLATIIRDSMKIGFSWGQTMAAVATELTERSHKDIVCLPMIGGPSGRLISDYHVNTITYEAAKKLNGRALLIDSPAIPETVALKEALLENEYNQELIRLWESLDIAILGIGSPHLQTNETWRQFYGDELLNMLTEQDVIGDVVSRFYKLSGELIHSELDKRIIGITPDNLKKTTYRIGVAESLDKVNAIKGALRAEYINVLVTTEETASKLIEE